MAVSTGKAMADVLETIATVLRMEVDRVEAGITPEVLKRIEDEALRLNALLREVRRLRNEPAPELCDCSNPGSLPSFGRLYGEDTVRRFLRLKPKDREALREALQCN